MKKASFRAFVQCLKEWPWWGKKRGKWCSSRPNLWPDILHFKFAKFTGFLLPAQTYGKLSFWQCFCCVKEFPPWGKNSRFSKEFDKKDHLFNSPYAQERISRSALVLERFVDYTFFSRWGKEIRNFSRSKIPTMVPPLVLFWHFFRLNNFVVASVGPPL